MKTILVFNSGSSSLKFSLFDFQIRRELLSADLERIGQRGSFITFDKQGKSGQTEIKQTIVDYQMAVEVALGFIVWQGFDLRDIVKVGHRVVHGGGKYNQALRLTDRNIWQLESFSKFAPLHNPVNLAVIRIARRALPLVPHWACFDTAWYKDLSPEFYLYNLPIGLSRRYRIRRYGFHGLSHEYVTRQAGRRLHKPLSRLNVITCHLGAGVSLTAFKSGKVLTTSMGLTPLDGLMMSTRSGSLDPFIPIYLQEEAKLKPAEIYRLLNFESGWYGLSGVKDFRQIMVDAGYPIAGFKKRKSAADRRRSVFALGKFIYELKFYIGGYAGLLGRVDAVVFTGSIGSRNSQFRRLVMSNIKLTGAKILALTTNEELIIARQLRRK